MNELKELLDVIEKRAEKVKPVPSYVSDIRKSQADVPALVKALKLMIDHVTHPQGSGFRDIGDQEVLEDVASLLKGKQP